MTKDLVCEHKYKSINTSTEKGKYNMVDICKKCKLKSFERICITCKEIKNVNSIRHTEDFKGMCYECIKKLPKEQRPKWIVVK